MQIASSSTAYGGGEAQRLLSMLMAGPPGQGGQNLPQAASDATGAGGVAPPGPAPSGGQASQFAADTLFSLLGLQQQPSSSDIAQSLIQQADTDGDGQLGAGEIKTALGANAPSDDAINQALQKLDANGDGKLSASELQAALDSQAGVNGHHHHHHGGHGHGMDADKLAASIVGAADSNGDGSLSLAEIQAKLGGSGSGSDFSQAFGALDANGDGQLSAQELTTALQAFQGAQGHAAGAQAGAAATA